MPAIAFPSVVVARRSRSRELRFKTGSLMKRRSNNPRAVRASRGLLTALACVMAAQGCYSTREGLLPPSVTQIFAPKPMLPNPLVIASDDFEAVWNKTVAEIDKYFEIESENRLSRTIRTQPIMGATLFEPWSPDSTTFRDRVEATLQTVRRFAIAKVEPAPTGGYQVRVEVRQELEDMPKPDRQAAGRAVFLNDFPINTTRELVGPVPVPLGWITQKRDVNLEQSILAGIRNGLVP